MAENRQIRHTEELQRLDRDALFSDEQDTASHSYE